MPAIRATSQNSDITQTRGKEIRGGARRAPVSLADQHNWLPTCAKLIDPAGDVSQRHVESTGQVSRRGGEFLGLAHIDEDNRVAHHHSALQFGDIDPCRLSRWSPTKQTGQNGYHGEHSEPDAACRGTGMAC
jgi:hypothetical protein